MSRQVSSGQQVHQSCALDHRVMMHAQTAIGGEACIQLHAVGPESPRPNERFERVFDNPLRRIWTSPMSLNFGCNRHVPSSFRRMKRTS